MLATGSPPQTIVALATDDTFAHVYLRISDLLADDDIGSGPGERSGAMEFFDGNGRALAPVFSPQWQIRRLRATGARPAPDELQRRLRRVVEHSRTYLRRHPDEAQRYGLDPAEAEALLPDLDGLDLRSTILTFAATRDQGDVTGAALADEDSGGFWHNLRHRAGWNHS
jgi:hypothetical protein